MTNLTSLLSQAAALQAKVDIGRQAKQELEPLRYEIMLEMNKLGMDKHKPVDGYYALYVQTPKRYIDDPEAVLDWLSENGYDYTQYQELNSTKILELADEIKTEDGEILPGIGVDLAERIDLKKVKTK